MGNRKIHRDGRAAAMTARAPVWPAIERERSGPDRSMPQVVGNWKMNGIIDSVAEVDSIARHASGLPVDVRLALPATLIALAVPRRGEVTIGAQNVHQEHGGAWTGGISAMMLRNAGAQFTLVGHSECRAPHGGDDDRRIAAKLAAARMAGLCVILCVGETADDRRAGRAEQVVEQQLRHALPDIVDGRWLSIAYEPCWAIGSGEVPSLAQIAAMHQAIGAVIDSCVMSRAAPVPLLYGGSVNGANAGDILSVEWVDGLLVGNASLTVESFLPIVQAAAALSPRRGQGAAAAAAGN